MTEQERLTRRLEQVGRRKECYRQAIKNAEESLRLLGIEEHEILNVIGETGSNS